MSKSLKTGAASCVLLLVLAACNQSTPPPSLKPKPKNLSPASAAWLRQSNSFIEEYMLARPCDPAAMTSMASCRT